MGADQRFFLERGVSVTSHITDGLRKQNFIANNKWKAYNLLNNEVDLCNKEVILESRMSSKGGGGGEVAHLLNP